MDRVRQQIGVPIQEDDCNKRNVTVAILDTGVGNHPDLSGKVIGFRDFVEDKKNQYDDNGHGTHISGIVCGSGALSGGKIKGMAPQSRLVVGKVLDRSGEGLARHMLRALDWILEVRETYEIGVLNISVGIGDMKDEKKEEALQKKIEQIWDSGIVVVCAAGNKGPKEGSISAVCGSKKVITVGCHDGDFSKENPKRCATYSGRGALAAAIKKPDIVAPGTDIRSCNVHYRYQYNKINGWEAKEPYVVKSGTSMATPIIAGAVALLLQKFPDMSNEEVKRKLMYTATDLKEPWNLQGWGMVNVKKLLERY